MSISFLPLPRPKRLALGVVPFNCDMYKDTLDYPRETRMLTYPFGTELTNWLINAFNGEWLKIANVKPIANVEEPRDAATPVVAERTLADGLTE